MRRERLASQVPVLRLANAGVRDPEAGGWRFRGLDASFEQGQLYIITQTTQGMGRALLNVAGGLQRPDEGDALVGELDWRELTNDVANSWRGRIHWAFREPAWLPYLTVADGITLEERFHKQVNLDELDAEAERLCRWFGLPGLPTGYPPESTIEDLFRAECARAFMGEPLAIVLEDLLSVAPLDLAPRLASAIRRALQRGATVIYNVRTDIPQSIQALGPTNYHLTPTGLSDQIVTAASTIR